MGDFFSKISSQFTGAVVLSAFFPLILFMVAFTQIVLPMTSTGQEFTKAVQDPQYWQSNPFVTLVFTVLLLGLSVVLYNLNTPIVRLYEGYPWKDSWIGQRRRRRHERYLEKVGRTRQRIVDLRKEARIAGVTVAGELRVTSQPGLARIANFSYPHSAALLPTRLGNTIRAFETYPRRQYNMDGVSFWPRLQTLLDSPLVQSLDGVKTAFDFMIHCSFLSAILAAVTLVFGLYWHPGGPWPLWGIGFGLSAYLFYLASISRATEWGAHVRTAFDLHRLRLLEKLGYTVKPADLADERRIWTNINYKLAFPDERVYPDLSYAAEASNLVVHPPDVILKASRTVALRADGAMDITLTVTNSDPTASSATNVIAREQIPAGMRYVRDSAASHARSVVLRSIDPLEIELGELRYDTSITLQYRLAKVRP